ncbi:MAG: hypothetical protein V7K55_21050 [Nostoc sp.]|uniref:hypothetical protein n=1 Tax=Nostoc sp. TaxID=1180 RepID=UPI002FFBC14A
MVVEAIVEQPLLELHLFRNLQLSMGLLSGCLGISTFDAQITELGYVSRYFIYGIGLGLFQSPNNSTVMGAVPRERLGIALASIGATVVLAARRGEWRSPPGISRTHRS